MPVILEPEDEETWINPDENDLEKLLHFLKPYRSNMMEAYGVSRLVNNPRAEGPELIKPQNAAQSPKAQFHTDYMT